MMMIKRWAFPIIALLLPVAAGAQDDDFGMWFSANAKVGVTQKLDAEISAELRTFDNAGRIEQGFLEAGFDFKLADFASLEGAYRFTSALEDDEKFHFQHKFFAGVKSSLKAGRFTFQGRFRMQARIRTYLEEVQDQYPDFTGRLRLKATYKTPSFPINPFIYSETFIPMNKEPERLIGKNRFAGGMEYKISKQHSVEAAYIFQRDYLPSVADEHILNIGYNFRF